MKKNNLIIPIFLPFAGCLNRCIYCNQRLLHPQSLDVTSDTVDKTIADYTRTFKGRRDETNIEVAFYGGSFTGLKRDKQIQILTLFKKHLKDKTIDGLRFSTRPDMISDSILQISRENGVRTIEIGAQTFSDRVLQMIGRGHNAQHTRDAISQIKKYGFLTSLHLMFGLPGATYEDDIQSIEETVRLSPNYVRLHPTLVLKNTILEEIYRRGEYRPLNLNEAIEIIRYAMKRFLKARIRIIRVGLHNDENLRDSNILIAGPYHPSLRQIASRDL